MTKITPQNKQIIANKVNGYINSHEITQKIVADKTRVPKEYVNSILKGVFTYDAGAGKVGDIHDKHFYNLAELVDYNLKKVYWENKATPQLIQMLAILEEAKEHAYTRLIIGETGSGKTNTISLYKKQHPQSVFSVKVGSEDTLSVLLKKIAFELGIPASSQKSETIKDIAEVLKMHYDKGRKPQIIFDESEYMKIPALCSIKEFYDYLDKYCSIILVGTDQFIDTIDKLRKKNTKGIPQLYRRIKFGNRRLDSIDKTYKLFFDDLDDKEVKLFLRRICDNYGELHDVLVPVRREADRTNEPITVNFIKKVLNLSKGLYE